jgi:hypothetical protein
MLTEKKKRFKEGFVDELIFNFFAHGSKATRRNLKTYRQIKDHIEVYNPGT